MPTSVNEFKKSLTLEAFAHDTWMKPVRARCPGRWREATDAEQKRGIDYWLLIDGRWYSFEVKTENYPLNYFIEMYQLVESRRSFELGYAYKCEADFLVLTNLLGVFAVIVPRAEFLQHSVDFALRAAGSRELSLVINAKKDVVERAAIGIALSYADSLAAFQSKWALVNLASSLDRATQFVVDSLWYLKGDELRAQGAHAKMAEGQATYDKLVGLKANRLPGSKLLEVAMERLVPHLLGECSAPAISHRRGETFAWSLKGLVTSQAAFADRFTGGYTPSYCADATEVTLRVRGAGARASATANSRGVPA